MKITKQARRDAKALFRSCMSEGMLSEEKVRQVSTAVLEKKPRGYLAILSHLLHLVKLDIQNRTARVESAQELDEATQASIQDNLVQRYGNQLITHFVTNPGLIGGLRVQVGSDVYDGSVRSRLQSIQNAFNEQ
ncbi:MAG: F0F1 ATP synthase subunit delta [Limisphaerales bacterium]|jgi:F-type H+-transporting ATPase subunit delta